jgi:DNA invertase Pin-like site-specific DNA recombinase
MARRRLSDPRLAVAYVRVSKDDQRLGPEAQRAAIEAWAAREGVSVVAWHVDQGVCSVTPIAQRAGLVAALAAVREHRAGVLIVAKRDRIARKPALTEAIEQAAAAHGARVLSADGTSGRSGVEGVMMRGMSDLFAQVEREMIRERTRAALAAKSAKGERVGGVPYGLRVAEDGVHLVEDEAEQAVLRVVRELRASGLTLRAIVAELAACSLVSRTRRPFALTQVANMLAKAAA